MITYVSEILKEQLIGKRLKLTYYEHEPPYTKRTEHHKILDVQETYAMRGNSYVDFLLENFPNNKGVLTVEIFQDKLEIEED
jgi:hypothetical protein